MTSVHPPPIRRIAHLDMDAFYASVELLRYPQLKGLPVVIGGSRRNPGAATDRFPKLKDYAGRGVITTATYPARAFGVHSGMGLMKAAKLCPDALLLPVDFDEYRRFSRLFKSTILSITPKMEDRGIDEVYIDFTDAPGGQEEGGRSLAERIQKAIFEQTSLTCSIGVAPNKLISKLASEFHKPNGITILYEGDLQEKIWPLPCRKINGIGPKSEARLAQLGIHTIGDLARQDKSALITQFGNSYGAWMHEAAWGQDDSPVVTHSEPVSMSCETTFDRDLHPVYDKAELGQIFTALCKELSEDLQRKGYAGRTIGVKLRYDNFQRLTREQTIGEYTTDPAVIRRAAGQCLKRAPLDRRLRLLGVKASGLVRASLLQKLQPPRETNLQFPQRQ